MAIDPTGVLLAVVNNGSNTIFPFTIDSSGALTVDTLVGTGSAPLRVTFNDAP
jgi:hypothetical protein